MHFVLVFKQILLELLLYFLQVPLLLLVMSHLPSLMILFMCVWFCVHCPFVSLSFVGVTFPLQFVQNILYVNFPFFSHGHEILDSDPHLMILVGLAVCQMFFSIQDFLQARLLQLNLPDIYCHCGCEFEIVENGSIIVCHSLQVSMQGFRDGLPILDGSLLPKDLVLKKDWLITCQSESCLQFGSVQHLGTFFSSLKDLIKDTGYLFNDSDLLGLQNVVVEISDSETQNVDDDLIVQAALQDVEEIIHLEESELLGLLSLP